MICRVKANLKYEWAVELQGGSYEACDGKQLVCTSMNLSSASKSQTQSKAQ